MDILERIKNLFGLQDRHTASDDWLLELNSQLDELTRQNDEFNRLYPPLLDDDGRVIMTTTGFMDFERIK